METTEVREVSPRSRKLLWTQQDCLEFRLSRSCVDINAMLDPPAPLRLKHDSAPRDLAVRPRCNDIRTDTKKKVHMVSHHREGNHIDRHEFREELKAIDNPCASFGSVNQRLSPHAARDTVIDPRSICIDNVTASCGHAANLAPLCSDPQISVLFTATFFHFVAGSMSSIDALEDPGSRVGCSHCGRAVCEWESESEAMPGEGVHCLSRSGGFVVS